VDSSITGCDSIRNPTSEIRIYLSLALLEAGIFLVDDEQLAFPAYDLAISAALLNGCSNLHGYLVDVVVEYCYYL
jgi:hypothetical protein